MYGAIQELNQVTPGILKKICAYSHSHGTGH